MKKLNNRQIDLFPSCSEMVFRIGGDFEEIRTQMYNLIGWVKKEYCGEVGDGGKEKLSPEMKINIANIKKQIKDAKSLEDFEKIVIEFTCNYETFFKAEEDGEGLLVATCNNYGWDDVEKQDTSQDSDEYYNVAGYTHYVLHDIIDGYPIFKLEYEEEEHKQFPTFVFPNKGQEFMRDDDTGTSIKLKKGESVKFVVRDKIMFKTQNNHLVKVEEIQDKVLLNKIKILANLGGLD